MYTRFAAGLIAGLGGGIVCGIIWSVLKALGPFPMIEVIGAMFGKSTFTVGWVVHIIFSALSGGLFGYLMGPRVHSFPSSIWNGLIYGLFWWMASGLVLQPLFLGLAPFSPVTIPELHLMALSGLLGFASYGLVLGVVFFNLYRPDYHKPVVRRVVRERAVH